MTIEVHENDELIDARLDTVAGGVPPLPNPMFDPKAADKIRQIEQWFRAHPGVIA